MMGLGLTPVAVRAGAEQNWKLNLAEMDSWDELPDGLMIASPSNPTGVVMDDSELAEICRWCDARGVRLISDEIYHGLTYEGEEHSILEYTDQAFVLGGFSKAYAMTGWRIGYGAGPEQLIKAMSKLQSQSTSNPSSIAQWAAVEALNGPQGFIDDNNKVFKERRDLVVSMLTRPRAFRARRRRVPSTSTRPARAASARPRPRATSSATTRTS